MDPGFPRGSARGTGCGGHFGSGLRPVRRPPGHSSVPVLHRRLPLFTQAMRQQPDALRRAQSTRPRRSPPLRPRAGSPNGPLKNERPTRGRRTTANRQPSSYPCMTPCLRSSPRCDLPSRFAPSRPCKSCGFGRAAAHTGVPSVSLPTSCIRRQGSSVSSLGVLPGSEPRVCKGRSSCTVRASPLSF